MVSSVVGGDARRRAVVRLRRRALAKAEYEALLRSASSEEVSVEVTHTYEAELASSGCCGGSGMSEELREVPLASAFVWARKPDE